MEKSIKILITMIIGLLLIMYPKTPRDIVIDNISRSKSDTTFKVLDNAKIIYKGIRHKENLTLIGGTYQVISNYNIHRLFCYGANVEFLTTVKPHIVFSVGCTLHFSKPSSTQVNGSYLFLGSKIVGMLKGDNYLNIYNPIIYHVLLPFHMPYRSFIGILLLIAGTAALIKPLKMPHRFLHLTGALLGLIPAMITMLVIFLFTSAFFVKTGIRELNINLLSLGVYIHILSVYVYVLVSLFGMYFTLSSNSIYSYVPLMLGISALISHFIAVLTLITIILPVGIVSVMLIPDIYFSYHIKQ